MSKKHLFSEKKGLGRISCNTVISVTKSCEFFNVSAHGYIFKQTGIVGFVFKHSVLYWGVWGEVTGADALKFLLIKD